MEKQKKESKGRPYFCLFCGLKFSDLDSCLEHEESCETEVVKEKKFNE